MTNWRDDNTTEGVAGLGRGPAGVYSPDGNAAIGAHPHPIVSIDARHASRPQPIEITLDDAIARAELEALVGRELE